MDTKTPARRENERKGIAALGRSCVDYFSQWDAEKVRLP